MSIIILFVIAICCLPVMFCVKKATVIVTIAACMHIIWFITGPIMLSSLTHMQDALEKNIESAQELRYFQECADEYAIVNVAKL